MGRGREGPHTVTAFPPRPLSLLGSLTGGQPLNGSGGGIRFTPSIACRVPGNGPIPAPQCANTRQLPAEISVHRGQRPAEQYFHLIFATRDGLEAGKGAARLRGGGIGQGEQFGDRASHWLRGPCECEAQVQEPALLQDDLSDSRAPRAVCCFAKPAAGSRNKLLWARAHTRTTTTPPPPPEVISARPCRASLVGQCGGGDGGDERRLQKNGRLKKKRKKEKIKKEKKESLVHTFR